MEADLRAMLISDPALKALVNDRIYWDQLPQTAQRPCIVMYVISGTVGYHMQGPDGLNETRVQFDCQAVLTSDKWAVANALETLLSGYRGTVGGTYFNSVFKLFERDKTETPATPDNTFRVRQLDFEFWHKKAS